MHRVRDQRAHESLQTLDEGFADIGILPNLAKRDVPAANAHMTQLSHGHLALGAKSSVLIVRAACAVELLYIPLPPKVLSSSPPTRSLTLATCSFKLCPRTLQRPQRLPSLNSSTPPQSLPTHLLSRNKSAMIVLDVHLNLHPPSHPLRLAVGLLTLLGSNPLLHQPLSHSQAPQRITTNVLDTRQFISLQSLSPMVACMHHPFLGPDSSYDQLVGEK